MRIRSFLLLIDKADKIFFYIKYVKFLNGCRIFQKSLTTFVFYFKYIIFDRCNLIIVFSNIARVYLGSFEFFKLK